MIKKSALILVYFLFSIAAFSTPAAINVDYSTVVNPYHYRMLLGNNLGYWIAPAAYTANTAKINAAGSYLLRFPGGSNSDNYHWNGNGSYDANNITRYSTGTITAITAGRRTWQIQAAGPLF